MKILFLAFYFPAPPRNGYQVRAYNLLKRLGKKHEIHLLSLLGGAGTPPDLEHMKSFCASVYCYGKTDSNSWWKYILSLVHGLPYKVVNAYEPLFHAEIKKRLAETNVDLVLIDHTFLALYQTQNGSLPHVVSLMNLEHRILQSYASKRLGPRSWYAQDQMEKIKKFEMNLWPGLACIFVSPLEEAAIRLLHPHMNGVTIPNGAEVDFSVVARPAGDPHLVFVGNYSNFPNLEAVDYFMTQIFPDIQKSIPQVTMDIVGQSPPDRFREYENERVRVWANVENPKDRIALASVVVIPLKSGAGTKLKVLEAMSMGKPVVTTPTGAEGLALEHGENAFVADTSGVFAECVVRLLKDPELNQKMGLAAKNTVEQLYSWDAIALKLENYLLTFQRKGVSPCVVS